MPLQSSEPQSYSDALSRKSKGALCLDTIMRFVSRLLNDRAPSLTSSRNGTMTSRAPTPSRFSKSTTSYSETVEVKRPWKLLKRSSLQPLTLRLYKHRQLPTIRASHTTYSPARSQQLCSQPQTSQD